MKKQTRKAKKAKKAENKDFYFMLFLVFGASLLPFLTVGHGEEEDNPVDKERPNREGQTKEKQGKERPNRKDQDKEKQGRERPNREDQDKEKQGKERTNRKDQTGEKQGIESHNQGEQDIVFVSETLSKASGRTHTKREKKIGGILYLILVLGICLLPLSAMGVRGQQDKTENRTLASMPELFDQEGIHWDYLSEVGEYFNDHFAFRSELVALDAWVRTTVFGVSPVSDVIVGKDGWLYYTATLDDFQHKNSVSDRMLFNIAHNISLMQRYTESLGIEFLFTVAPNKNSLYGENMPQRLSYQAAAQSDMDRLLFWLEKEQVNYVDLFRLFQEQEEVLYYQRDSHWNGKGAVMVYNALLDACGKAHETYENSQTQIRNDYYGDLNRMLFPIGGEPEQDIDYMGGNEWMYSKGETVEDSLIITESTEGSQTLLMYRDSFGNSLLPLLAGEYAQAVFSKIVPYTMTDLAIYWPDVVIVEKVERHLPTFAEVPPLMSAPVTVVDGAQITIESNTTINWTKEGSYWKIFGTVDEDYMSTDDGIFVEITDADGTRVYEAFCLSLTGEHGSDYGYTIYLSEISLAGNRLGIKIITEKDDEIIVLKEEEAELDRPEEPGTEWTTDALETAESEEEEEKTQEKDEAQTGKGVKWLLEDGTWAVDCWVYESGRIYHIDENGYIQLGLTDIDGNCYYLYPEGKFARGWTEIDDSWYFFFFDGTLAVDTVVDGLDLGSDGRILSEGDEFVPHGNELRDRVDSILLSIITPEMTEEEKIEACYWYMVNNYIYDRTYETPDGDWTGEFALEILTTGKGNCYRFASAFAYLLDELGYETKVITGRIGTSQGGTTPHGWTEVKIEGEWYVFDTELQYANKDKDYYWKTYETYPSRTLEKMQEWPIHF